MPHADVDGQRIFFEDCGGDGPPVILTHGFLTDHEMFVNQVAALRDDDRVTTWHERGVGQMENDGEPFTSVHGREDVSISTDEAEAFVAGLAGSSAVVRVAGARAANLTNPEPVEAAIHEFLAGLTN